MQRYSVLVVSSPGTMVESSFSEYLTFEMIIADLHVLKGERPI